MKTCNEFNKFTDIIDKIQYFHCQAGGRALYVFEFSIFIDKARRHSTVCL